MPIAPVTASVIQPICGNPSTYGSITVTAPLSSSYYTYSIDGTTFQSSPTFSFVYLSGSYTVTAKDPVTLETSSLSNLVISQSVPANQTATVTQPYCLQSTGYIVLTNQYSSSWTYTASIQPSGPNIYGTSSGNFGLFSQVSSSAYLVYATDGNGCVSPGLAITVNAAPAPFTSSVGPVTSSILTSLTASIYQGETASFSLGTVTGASYYQWTPGNLAGNYTLTGSNVGTVDPIINLTGSVVNTSTLTVTPINVCAASSSTALITVNAIPPPIGVSSSVSYYKGDPSVPLVATASLTGSVLKWYTVLNGGVGSFSTPTPSTSLVGTTNYYVTTFLNSYESSPRTQIQVTVNPVPCSVLMLDSNGKVYDYNYGTNTQTFLTQTSGGVDIAMTNTKMWISNFLDIYEYDITLNPWTSSYNRTINISASYFVTGGATIITGPPANGSGLVAKNNTTLVMGGTQLANIDISGPTASYTTLFTLPTSSAYTGSVSGDIYYNDTYNTYLLTYNLYEPAISASYYYVAQFDSTGSILNQTSLSFNDGFGVFSSQSYAYISRGSGATYRINNDFSVTYTQNIPTSSFGQIFGAAQTPECSTVYYTPFIPPPPSPTPTQTVTSTPTSTPTITPTSTPTITPTSTPTITPTSTPTITPTSTPTITPTSTPTITPTSTPTPTSTITPTPTSTITPTITSTPTPTPTYMPYQPPTTSVVPYNLGLTAETTIYVNEVKCRVSENDFNYSQNPTVFKYKQAVTGSRAQPFYAPSGGQASWGVIVDGTLADNVTGSSFNPYATTIGLYNDSGQLLVVGKLGTPYPIPENTDMTFIVRWDS
jgi:hypothetical protein